MSDKSRLISFFFNRTASEEVSETPFCLSGSWRALPLQPYILHNEDEEPSHMDSPDVLGIAGEQVMHLIFSADRERKAKLVTGRNTFSLHTNCT
jgi:hypothetical protein